MTDITHEHDDHKGAYHIAVEGSEQPAELTWRKALRDDCTDVRIADHTFTPPEARGTT